MQSGFNQVIQLLEMASRTNTHIHLTVANKVKNCIIGENGLVVNQGALDFDPKRLIEKIVESSRAAKDEAEKCVAMYGKIQEFFIQSGTDVRNVTVSFKVDYDKELSPDFKEVLQKQIADAINVSNERIINIELIRHCILVFFDVDGASFPWETSSLILAERFRTGLTDGSIRLTDDKGETLAVCTETTIINMKTTSERTPVVAIGQGGYIMTAGEVTILTCTTLSSSPVTSVKWFRINKEEGIKTAIEIDNKKYYGGSIETPSLVIDNTCPEDVGQYVCHARNKYGSSKSPPTFLLVFSKVAMESSRARIEHLAYKQDITSTNGQTIPINSEIMSINQELVVHHRQDSNLDKPLDRTGATPRNLNGMEDNTSISFDIAGAMFPWEPSALLLAERFQSGLIDGSIRMAHKAGEQMSIRRDSTSIALAAPPDDPDCSGKPIVCLGQGGYMKAVGETSVLACAVVSSSKVTSVKWFRKIDKQKTPSEVQIDNTKYYGGSVDSPSLVINNTDHSDEGFYLCRAENNYGSGESQSALLQTFNSNDSQVTDNEARAVKQETVTTNQTTMEDSPSTAAVKQDALQRERQR
ncbi:contactin-5-like [Argopecten irradians]|uniref:contactin-5-like n=1 Tax=Argopecten irradians TaxID=31199 RepID=UPI0037158F1C